MQFQQDKHYKLLLTKIQMTKIKAFFTFFISTMNIVSLLGNGDHGLDIVTLHMAGSKISFLRFHIPSLGQT
jgi:hypothetical protein